jgi:cell wall-associated NlpC family hydrolase
MATIDISSKLGVDYSINWLKQNNIDSVIRYISRGDQTKCIDVNELQALIGAGIAVGIVYELYGGSPEYGGLAASINAASGKLDGEYALKTLKQLRVPQGVVVYFAVDTDVDNNNDINTYVIPYFQSAKQTIGGYYRIGAYGCGSTCAAALDTAGCDKAWLANANLWTGYQQFLAEGRAAIIQGKGSNQSSYDPDTIKDTDWGSFKSLAASAPAATAAAIAAAVPPVPPALAAPVPPAGDPPWLATARTFLGNMWSSGNPPSWMAHLLDGIAKENASVPGMAAYILELQSGYHEWCGMFVGGCLAAAGYPVPFNAADETGSLAYAPAWDTYGTEVPPEQIQPGDIMRWGWTTGGEHVTFYSGLFPNDDFYHCLGGNQAVQSGGYGVTIGLLPMDAQLKHIRRPPAALS